VFDVSQENDTAASRTREALSRQMLKKGRKMGNYCGRHFPVQRVAKATYWDILKRRAGDNRIDFIEGVAAALTPIAFFETVMVRKL